jgi:hypothetical protein
MIRDLVSGFARGVLGVLMLLGLAGAQCAQPQPIPTPPPVVDAAPPPPFTGLVVNCSEVRAQTVAARPAVQTCLATQLPADGCMVDLLTTWGPGPLACAVRAEGMQAFARGRTDGGTNTDQAVAKASRLWITSHGIGYKD